LWGTNAPTWNADDNGGTLTIKASSSTGFHWTWEQLSTIVGKSVTQDTGNLFIHYAVEVIKPVAVLTVKNPASMSDNAPEITGGNPKADWGQGGGSEYVLGNETLSNYTKGEKAGSRDMIVSGFYDKETGNGWFEVNPLVYPAGSTGVGFVHNYWCDMGSPGTKNAENSEYVLKILRITLGDPDLEKVSIAAIHGVDPPARGQTPVTAIADAEQYTGAVAWEPEIAEGGTFAPSTAYTATITLTAKSGYTFEGVEADFFTVDGADTVTNAADSGVVTAVFPATVAEDQDTPVSLSVIAGVTAPAAGATPVTAITATAQYTGTVTWSPSVTGTFAYGMAYTATITLTAAEGFTFDGVAADHFTVAGADTVSNAANSGEVTAVFPATAAPTVINIAAITGVTEPIRGHDPVTAINPTTQYAGTVSWDGELDSEGKFAASTVYTATITLTPETGYTLTGVTANFFTVQHATATNPANSGVVTAVFSATADEGVDTPVDIFAIDGVSAPIGGEEPVTTAPTETDQWTASVIMWTPAVTTVFAYEQVYTATFTLTAKESLTFDGVEGPFTVAGATVTFVVGDPPNTVTITAVFPVTGPTVYVDNNPVLTSNQGAGNAQGTWNGNVTGSSASWSGGAVRYAFPTAEGFDIADYDFFEIEYTGGAGKVILKQFDTGTNYPYVTNPYPTLSETGTLKFEIRGAETTGGVALQRNDVDATITVTKVTFTKGTRYPITFSLGALEGVSYTGTDSVPTSPAYVLDGAVFGPLPDVSWAPNRFNGWTKGAAGAVTATTVVDSSFNNAVITAQWLPPKVVLPINVTFTNVSELTGYNATPTLSGNGYTITPSQGNGYAWVKFRVDFGEGNTISDYDKLTFTIVGSGNDMNYKYIFLAAGTSITSGTNITDAANNPLVINTLSNWNYGDTSTNLTLTIDKNKTTSLTAQELDIIILPNAPASAIYTITNIQFSQN
jgi:hypothetical protein